MTEFQKNKVEFKKALNEGIAKVFASGKFPEVEGEIFAADVRNELRRMLASGDETAKKIIDAYSVLLKRQSWGELFMYADRFQNNVKDLEDFEYNAVSFGPGINKVHLIKRK